MFVSEINFAEVIWQLKIKLLCYFKSKLL